MPFAPLEAAMIFSAVRDGRGDRLFEEHVLAGFERGDGRLGVLVPHGADRDGVDVGIGQHVVIVAVELLDAELLAHRGQPVGRARAEGREFEVGNAGDGLGMDLAEPAQPDHADAQTVHHLASLVRNPRASVRAPSRCCRPSGRNRPAGRRR